MPKPKKRTYSIDKYDIDELYNNPLEDTLAQEFELKRDKTISGMRTKTIISGDMLEVEIFPIWNTGSATRVARQMPSRKTQQNLNKKNSAKKAIRLINANFTETDIYATFTYDEDHLPKTVKAAEKEVYKYLRRIKSYMSKNNLGALKFLYVTHKGKKTNRIHHHIIMNFKDRDIAEQLWHGGERTNARRLQPDEFGYEGVTRYMLNEAQGEKKYSCSRNLDKPTITRADKKITKGGVEKIIKGFNDPKILFERLYKNYSFNDMNAFTSDYASGAYVYVRMRRRH